MFRRVLLLCVLLSLALAPAAMAQDGDKPTIAMMGFGWFPSYEVTEGAIFDLLQSYGFISAEENSILESRQDLDGEYINIFWIDPGRGRDELSIAVENAIDQEPDVLVTLTSWLTQTVISITHDMDEPPAIIFGSVNYPYRSGIAKSPCIKPAHVIGSESLTPFDYVMSLLKVQNPDLVKIGTLHNSNEDSSAWGIERIRRIAADYDIEVESEGIVQLADVRAATDALIDDGIEAFVLPYDYLTSQALPVIAIAANEAGIPVFHPSLGAIYYGATVGGGFYLYYEDGTAVGRMLTAFLNGELDIANTAISQQSSQGLGVNLDAAYVQGIEMSAGIMAQVDAVIEGGELTQVSPELQLILAQQGVIVPMEDRLEDDREWLAALECTPERIQREQEEIEARAAEEDD